MGFAHIVSFDILALAGIKIWRIDLYMRVPF